MLYRQFEKNKKGIFGMEDYKLPFEEGKGKQPGKWEADSMKKLHSLYFPVSWREALISTEIIFLLMEKETVDTNFIKSTY